MLPLKTQAIHTALHGKWGEAIALNQQLLKDSPEDIETLNRLGFAFTVIGNIKEAKNSYKKVLELDSQNPIAQKNLKRLSAIAAAKNGEATSSTESILPPNTDIGNMFIEESGKTKVVELVNVAESKIISLLRTGIALELSIKRSKIFVLDAKHQYVGMLPDDLAKRLIEFITGGNTYTSYVKSVSNRHVIIFLRELKKAAKFKNQPSFMLVGKTKSFETNAKNQRKDDIEDEPESSDDES